MYFWQIIFVSEFGGGGGRGEAEKTCVKKLLRGYRSLHYNIRIHLCVNK